MIRAEGLLGNSYRALAGLFCLCKSALGVIENRESVQDGGYFEVIRAKRFLSDFKRLV